MSCTTAVLLLLLLPGIMPCRVTMIAIKGDVEGIQRSPGRTEVLVDEGLASSSYTLDEALIDFGSALDDLVSTWNCNGDGSGG